jgi:hypothetical protein
MVYMYCSDPEAYEQRNLLDSRQILFKAQDKAELDILFADQAKLYFEETGAAYLEEHPHLKTDRSSGSPTVAELAQLMANSQPV